MNKTELRAMVETYNAEVAERLHSDAVDYITMHLEPHCKSVASVGLTQYRFVIDDTALADEVVRVLTEEMGWNAEDITREFCNDFTIRW